MISNLENGPTEEDLELLINDEERINDILFVDLTNDFNNNNNNKDLYNNEFENITKDNLNNKQLSNKKMGLECTSKYKLKKIKYKKLKKRSVSENNFDELSINSDDFIVPDDEIIPPDWEYNFQEPIVCQDVTFYNKIDNFLIKKRENKETNLLNQCDNSDDKLLVDLNIENEYIDDKDNTELILKNNLYIKNKEEYNINSKSVKNKFIRDEIVDFNNLSVNDLKRDCLMNIKDIYIKIRNFVNVFNHKYNISFDKYNKDTIEDDFSELILIFKSIDIEFNDLLSNNNSNIHKHLDLFYVKIRRITNTSVNKLDSNKVNLIKELHIEMSNFLQNNIEEIKIKIESFDSKILIFYLKIIGLTILIEHLLILSLRIINDDSLKESLKSLTPSLFNDYNKFNRNSISKILRKVFNELLSYILNLYINDRKYNKVNLEILVILILFLNIKLNGNNVFTYINTNLNNDIIKILKLFNFSMFICSNIKDQNVEMSILFPEVIFNKNNSNLNNRNEYYNYFCLLNNYLLATNIYTLNRKRENNNTFESFNYLNEFKILNNLNVFIKETFFLIYKDDKELLLDILQSNIELQNFNLENIKGYMSNSDKILKLFLFLDFDILTNNYDYFKGDNTNKFDYKVENNNLIKSLINNEKNKCLDLIQRIYFNLLYISINLINDVNGWNSLLEHISNIFDFENASYINKHDIIIHFIISNSLLTLLCIHNNQINKELNSLLLKTYKNYIEENDKIHNFLLTEIILNDNINQKKLFKDNIYLNKFFKLFIKIFLNKRIDLCLELDFYLNIIENILELMNNNKVDDFDVMYSTLEENSIHELMSIDLPNKANPFNDIDLVLYSSIIELFNKNKLFNIFNNLNNVDKGEMHAKMHARMIYLDEMHAKKLHLNDINKYDTSQIKLSNSNNSIIILNENYFKRFFIYYKILFENILDNYLLSVFNISIKVNGSVIYYERIQLLFDFLNNIIRILISSDKGLCNNFIKNLINNYCKSISKKVFFYYNKEEDIKLKNRFISYLIHYSYNFLCDILDCFNLEENNNYITGDFISLIIVVNILILNNKYYMEKFYKSHKILESKLFKYMNLIKNDYKYLNFKKKQKVSLNYIKNNNLMDYCYKYEIINNLQFLYDYIDNFDNNWKNEMKIILINLFSEYKINKEYFEDLLNNNKIYLKLFFEYYINTLDNEFLQSFNKNIMNHSYNLYSCDNIYGLLMNIILKGFDEKKIHLNKEFALNWNYINNSVKGYINQLNNDQLIYDWICNNFMHLFIVPSSFIHGFINIRVNFWINILTIPLSKLVIYSNNSIDNLNEISVIIQYPLNYLRKIIKLHDFIILKEYILNFSINYIIDINRLIHLSYFNIILKFILTNHKNVFYLNKCDELIIRFSQLLILIIITLQIILVELNNSLFDDLTLDIIHNINILKSYFIEISEILISYLNKNNNCSTEDSYLDLIEKVKINNIIEQNSWINQLIYENKQRNPSFIFQYIVDYCCNNKLNSLFKRLIKVYHHIKNYYNKNYLFINNLFGMNYYEANRYNITLNILEKLIKNIQNNYSYDINHFMQLLS